MRGFRCLSGLRTSAVAHAVRTLARKYRPDSQRRSSLSEEVPERWAESPLSDVLDLDD
jgi:hypothetical protein